jgi:hypothetical protein
LRRVSIYIEGVIAETVNVRRQIGVDAGQRLFCDPFASRWSSCTMRVNEQTLWKIKQLATRWLYLMTLRCSSRLFAAEESPFEKAVELLALGGGRLDRGPQLLIGLDSLPAARRLAPSASILLPRYT